MSRVSFQYGVYEKTTDPVTATPRTRRYEILNFRREHLLEVYSKAGHVKIRTQTIQAHASQILAKMRAEEHHLIRSSESLTISMQEHIESLCRLAYNYGQMIKTHDQLWRIHTSSIGSAVSTLFVDVVGDVEGQVCQGFAQGHVVALNVFPALFRSREENAASMKLVEKGWVVADRF